jgi:hypothetical protein
MIIGHAHLEFVASHRSCYDFIYYGTSYGDNNQCEEKYRGGTITADHIGQRASEAEKCYATHDQYLYQSV